MKKDKKTIKEETPKKSKELEDTQKVKPSIAKKFNLNESAKVLME